MVHLATRDSQDFQDYQAKRVTMVYLATRDSQDFQDYQAKRVTMVYLATRDLLEDGAPKESQDYQAQS